MHFKQLKMFFLVACVLIFPKHENSHRSFSILSIKFRIETNDSGLYLIKITVAVSANA